MPVAKTAKSAKPKPSKADAERVMKGALIATYIVLGVLVVLTLFYFFHQFGGEEKTADQVAKQQAVTTAAKETAAKAALANRPRQQSSSGQMNFTGNVVADGLVAIGRMVAGFADLLVLLMVLGFVVGVLFKVRGKE